LLPPPPPAEKVARRSERGGPPGKPNGQYRHGERTKGAIAERQKFSALLKMLCAGQPTHQFPQGGFAKPIELQPFV
jgi:hypothetical protein